jgi:peptidyl-prolyl cis-trans isomerase D
MRKFSKSWFSTLLLGGLALSFVLWGIGDIFRGTTSTAVATVGSTKIDQQEFSRDYRNTIRMLGMRQQTEITQEEARRLGLPMNTLKRRMDEVALDNYAAGLGLTVSDDTVNREVQSAPGFQGVLGTFDHQVFLQRISQLGFSEGEFIALMRRDLSRAQLRTGVEDGFSAPVGYVGALYAYLSEARAVDYVVVTPTEAGAVAPPSDTDLRAYVKAHPGQFSTPEYRTLTYAAIGPEDFEGKITISDKQLHDAYDEHKTDYVVAEKRDADQISFPTEAEASAARARIDGGMTFDALAAARKLSAKTIDMGTVTKDQITDKAQADALFSAPLNGVTQPVKGPFGYILMRVRKITPALNKSFEDAKPDLEKQLKTELAASSAIDIVNKFTDALSAGDDMAQAGKAAGMRVVQVPAVDANGLAPDGQKANVPGGDFLKAAFAAEVGVDGDAFQTADGHNYAIKVSGVTPPKLKTLDVVRADATAAWMREARATALSKKAEAIAAAATSAHALTGNVQKSGRLTRQTTSDIFSAKLLTAIFSKPAGAVVTGPLAKGEGYIVARITGVSHPQVVSSDQTFRSVGQALSRQISSDIADSFAAAEGTRQGKTINQKLLDQAVGAESS